MHEMQKYTIQLIGRQLRNELTSQCSEAANSTLRSQSADALRGFTWGKLHDELAARTPTLLTLLELCTYTRKPCLVIIGMCTVLLLKFRFHKVCLVQKIVSLLLYADHSDKQVKPNLYGSVSVPMHRCV